MPDGGHSPPSLQELRLCLRDRGDVQSQPPDQFIYSDPDIFGDSSEKER
jgi:hypothetical protein